MGLPHSCDHVRFGRPSCAGSVCLGISCTCGAFPGQMTPGVERAEQRRKALFQPIRIQSFLHTFQSVHGTVLSANLPKIVISGRRSWKTSLQIIVTSPGLVHKASGPSPHAGDGRNRSRSPKGPTKKQRGRDGGVARDGRHRTTPAGKQICFEFNRNVGGCGDDCGSKRAHVCEFCLEPHRTVECPGNPRWKPPKGAGKGTHKGKR